MSNRTFRTIASLGIALPADCFTQLEAKFAPKASYELILPTRSVDPIQVQRTGMIEYRIYGHYTNPTTKESAVVLLASNTITLSIGTSVLIDSDPYKALGEKSRTNLDKTMRNMIRHMRKAERIATNAANAAPQPEVADPAADLTATAPVIIDDENVITAEDEANQQARIEKLRNRVGGYTENAMEEIDYGAALMLVASQVAAGIVTLSEGAGADKVLEPAINALKMQADSLSG